MGMASSSSPGRPPFVVTAAHNNNRLTVKMRSWVPIPTQVLPIRNVTDGIVLVALLVHAAGFRVIGSTL